MDGWLEVLKLTGGLVYLLLGGDLLVRGAIGFSARTHIPEALVGLTIVALGTSAPELFVSVYAALAGHAEIAVGNVVGSNVANVLLVLGVPALISPIVTRGHGSERRDVSFMLAVTALFIGLCFLPVFGTIAGLTLLAVLVVGLWVMYDTYANEEPGGEVDGDEEIGLPDRASVIALFLVLGIVMLPLGADLTVDSASAIALQLGVSEAVVAASLIALGTSLPELSTTVIAATHGRSSIALGNVIGSNVLNIALIMGVTALLTDVPIPETFLREGLWVMLGATVVLWGLVIRGTTLGRKLGFTLLAGYGSYMGLLYG